MNTMRYVDLYVNIGFKRVKSVLGESDDLGIHSGNIMSRDKSPTFKISSSLLKPCYEETPLQVGHVSRKGAMTARKEGPANLQLKISVYATGYALWPAPFLFSMVLPLAMFNQIFLILGVQTSKGR